ncbi:hypothetical protein K503DRAFT_718849 [Rhizopogon vinicolor AM-OR11-026]|uniref:DUF6533 domain-containing protein n=1 Tax=Rhizopogon vinicolor AM-OR11-026 TaxID=1314800 RepID=A0A1B7MZL7_9AGAM|nr:hypothetical protein K503DRAFT_718849 [Rhizopogon vinicolor AM-OR11-026]
MFQLLVIDSETSEKYLRIASVSIALYDYILTLPAEWRFYRSQSSIFHLNLACILFIAMRYFSVAVLLFSNYGFFATTFTDETCKHYHILAPVFKVIQIMISQAILGVRTFNIAKRGKYVGISLLLLYAVSTVLEWFTNVVDRYPVTTDHSCISGSASKTIAAWFYYLAAMMYDLAMLAISTTYLLRYSPLSSRLEQLIRVLIYDGIGFFLALTGTNVFNLIIYHTTGASTQSAGASLGYAVTWIMSQRILIHLREMKESRRLENVVLARPARNALSGLHSHFRSKSPIDAEFAHTTPRNLNPNDVEMDIRVCVERSVMVDCMAESENGSSYGKSAVK